MIFLEIDNDEGDNEDIADEYNVKNLPTFIVIKDGKEQERIMGADKEKLQSLISKYFKASVKSAFSMDEDF